MSTPRYFDVCSFSKVKPLTVRHVSRTGSGNGSRIKRHAGIDYFPNRKLSQEIRVPMFKSARESHFHI